MISNPDIINSCRVCRSPNQDGDYQYLYQSSTNHGERRVLSESGMLYEYLFNVPLNERKYYPQCLCNSCELQMKLFKKLKDNAYKTLEFLENLYDQIDNDQEYIQELTHGYSILENQQDNDQEQQECSEVCQDDEFEIQGNDTNVNEDGSDKYVTCDIRSENKDIARNEYQENIEFAGLQEVREYELQRNTAYGCEIGKLSAFRNEEENDLCTNIAQEANITPKLDTPTQPSYDLLDSKETNPEIGINFESMIDKDDYVTEIYELVDDSNIESQQDDNVQLLQYDPYANSSMEAISPQCDVEYVVEEYVDDIGNGVKTTTQHTISVKKRKLNKDCRRKTSTSKTIREYKCKPCHLEFKSSQEHKLHRTQHHDEKYSCDVCSKELNSITALDYHMKVHNGQPPFQCEICQKTFIQKAHYQYHMNRHNNVRNFKCDICEKAFLSKTDLKVHLRLHTGERPYVCNICGKDYMMMEHLKTHLLSHTDQEFQCDICNNIFSTHKTLRLHVQTIHADEPRFKCVFCLKPFRRKHHLQYHMKLHEKNLDTFESGYELIDDPDAINEMEINTDDLAEQYSVDPGFIALDD